MVGREELSGSPDEGRVKPCLECGTILPFDATTCSLCGAPVGGGDEEAVKPCLACEKIVPFDAFYCPECGDFAAPLEGPPPTRAPRPRGWAERILPALSVGVALWVGLLACGLAVGAAIWSRRLALAAS